MRLRWILAFAFICLSVLQLAIVAPLALRNLSVLLKRQQEARVNQLMVAVKTEVQRLEAEVQRSMDELVQSQALEDVARDATRIPAPSHVTTAASVLMTPRGLEVLALIDDKGRTLSSGHLPARLGEPKDPLFAVTQLPLKTTVATQVELSLPEGLIEAPALVTARPVDYGERRVWVVGGILLSVARAEALSQLAGAKVEIKFLQKTQAEAGSAEPPVLRRSVPIGQHATAHLSFSTADLSATRNEVLRAFLGFAGVGLLFALVFAFLVSRRVTRPVEALTEAAREIAGGAPGVTVDRRFASSELRELIDTFNRMTGELKEATDKLVASERIAAWQEVARRLAHEIKNPLTPIRMSLETLLAASQRGAIDPRFEALFKDSSRAMLEEVERLKRIVDEFSQFARLPKPQMALVDLREMVKTTMSLYSDHEGIQFKSHLGSAVWVKGDKQQLNQVLINLLKNAQEAMAGRAGVIDVRVRQEENSAILEVEDDGPGIPAELKARLFEPYITSKPQGTGLGLAIVLRLIEEHGGQIEVHDGAAQGALFRVILPSTSVSSS